MKILLIEDDVKLSDSMAFQLKKEGFAIDIADDGEDGLFSIYNNHYDLILLDRMLPHMDGVTVLKEIRAKEIAVPVIMITALGQLENKVEGLDSGADDYIVKPFAFEELMARIRSICRRPRQWEGEKPLSFGDIAFQPQERQLFRKDTACSLSKREADLMEMFLLNSGQTIPRQVLLTRVWGHDADVEDGNLDNYIHFLRRRLKALDSRLTLKTVRGVGYRLEDQDV